MSGRPTSTQTSPAFQQRHPSTVETSPIVAHHFSSHFGATVDLQLVLTEGLPSDDVDPESA